MPCNRQEGKKVYPLANGRRITITVRSAIVPEDPFINMARAAAYAIRTLAVNTSPRVERGIKDFLIKTNLMP